MNDIKTGDYFHCQNKKIEWIVDKNFDTSVDVMITKAPFHSRHLLGKITRRLKSSLFENLKSGKLNEL